MEKTIIPAKTRKELLESTETLKHWKNPNIENICQDIVEIRKKFPSINDFAENFSEDPGDPVAMCISMEEYVLKNMENLSVLQTMLLFDENKEMRKIVSLGNSFCKGWFNVLLDYSEHLSNLAKVILVVSNDHKVTPKEVCNNKIFYKLVIRMMFESPEEFMEHLRKCDIDPLENTIMKTKYNNQLKKAGLVEKKQKVITKKAEKALKDLLLKQHKELCMDVFDN